MKTEAGIYILHLLEGIGIAVMSGLALWWIPRSKNPLQGADKTTWLYRTLGPQGLKTLLLGVFVLLLLFGIYRIVHNARKLVGKK